MRAEPVHLTIPEYAFTFRLQADAKRATTVTIITIPMAKAQTIQMLKMRKEAPAKVLQIQVEMTLAIMGMAKTVWLHSLQQEVLLKEMTPPLICLLF